MNELRISLIVIGVALVAAVYAWAKYMERARQSKSRKEPVVGQSAQASAAPETEKMSGPHDLRLDAEPEQTVSFAAADAPPVPVPAFAIKGAATSLALEKIEEPRAAPRAATTAATTKEKLVKEKPAEKRVAFDEEQLVVVMNLMARPEKTLRGSDIATALEGIGMELGAMDIFHFHAQGEDDERPVFSVANAVRPGTFARDELPSMSCAGLALFMRLPGPLTASEAFDTMLEKARLLEKRLDAQLCDETRGSLTPQTVRNLRDKMMDYDFRRFNAQQARDEAPRANA